MIRRSHWKALQLVEFAHCDWKPLPDSEGARLAAVPVLDTAGVPPVGAAGVTIAGLLVRLRPLLGARALV